MQKRNVLRYQSTSKTAYLLDWEWCNDSPSQGSDPGGKEGEQWEGQSKDREGQRHAWRGQHAEYEDALATLASQATSPSQCPPWREVLNSASARVATAAGQRWGHLASRENKERNLNEINLSALQDPAGICKLGEPVGNGTCEMQVIFWPEKRRRGGHERKNYMGAPRWLRKKEGEEDLQALEPKFLCKPWWGLWWNKLSSCNAQSP